jgi:hypothetical protein
VAIRAGLKVDVVGQPVHDWIALRLEGPEQPVPHDEECGGGRDATRGDCRDATRLGDAPGQAGTVTTRLFTARQGGEQHFQVGSSAIARTEIARWLGHFHD